MVWLLVLVLSCECFKHLLPFGSISKENVPYTWYMLVVKLNKNGIDIKLSLGTTFETNKLDKKL